MFADNMGGGSAEIHGKKAIPKNTLEMTCHPRGP